MWHACVYPLIVDLTCTKFQTSFARFTLLLLYLKACVRRKETSAAMETFYIMSLFCIIISLLATQYYCKTRLQADTATAAEERWDGLLEEVDQRIHTILAVDSDDSDAELSPAEAFGNLRARFLSAYTFVVAADWLQVRSCSTLVTPCLLPCRMIYLSS
jgi:hypothetical protein